MTRHRFLPRLFRFLRRQDGGPTVETVLWFPLIMAVFMLTFDGAMILHGRETILDVIQRANRERSVGRITTNADLKTYVEAQLKKLGITATASPYQAAGVIRVTVAVKSGQLGVIGMYTAMTDFNIQVTAEQMIENWEV